MMILYFTVTVPKVRAAISGPKLPGKRSGDKKSTLSAVKTPR